MATEHVFQRIRNLIGDGDLGEALDELRSLTLGCTGNSADEAITLAGRHATLRRDQIRGRVTAEAARVEVNLIRDALLDLLKRTERKMQPSESPIEPPMVPSEDFAGAELVTPEQMIGVNNLRQIAWVEQGLAASRAVCRVLTPTGKGSGFLVGSEILMTNHHVIPSLEVAGKTQVEFNYQLPFGSKSQPQNSVRYHLDPAKLFRTSPFESLDYTLVALKHEATANKTQTHDWGHLLLNPSADPVRAERLAIIQHPNAGPKQIVLTGSAVIGVKPPHINYSTDTMEGSSGSPVFNDLWKVIAIHHASGPTTVAKDGRRFRSNQGVLMSAIQADLGKDWPQ